VIEGFRCGRNVLSSLLGFYSASFFGKKPTYRDRQVVPKRWFLTKKTRRVKTQNTLYNNTVIVYGESMANADNTFDKLHNVCSDV
jgi:hypothetical protein